MSAAAATSPSTSIVAAAPRPAEPAGTVTLGARTLRYRALGHCPQTYVPAAPDRRWARVLRAVCDTPLSSSQIHRAVRRREGAPGRERREEEFKTLRTLRSLSQCGLLVRTTQGGLVATFQGLAILAAAEAAAGWRGDGPADTYTNTGKGPDHE